jgi:hypothetical protein
MGAEPKTKVQEIFRNGHNMLLIFCFKLAALDHSG